MQINQGRMVASAIAVAALFASAGARASLVYLPDANSLFQGAGLGAVNTVLTLGSQGSSTEESGAVFAVGSGFDTVGDTFDGTSQVGLPTLGSLNITSTSALRIVLNAAEPAGDSITVSSLGLTFYDALGAGSTTFALAAPVTLASTLTGIGKAGFVFGLDAAQAAAAAIFIGNSTTSFANFRVGLSATLNDATGGPETFFIANAAPVLSPIPEPETWAMVLAGLGAGGFMARRRVR